MRVIWLRKAEIVFEDDAKPVGDEGEGEKTVTVELDEFNLRECWEAYSEEIAKADHIRVFNADGKIVKRIWLIDESGDHDWMEGLPEYNKKTDEKVTVSKASSEVFFDTEIVPLLAQGYKFIVANGAEILTMFDAEGVHLF
jgi:phosphoketolase